MPSFLGNSLARMKGGSGNTRDLPPVQLSNPAQEFVDNRVEVYHPKSFASATESVDSPEDQPSSKEADDPKLQDEEEDDHCKQFAEVLEAFENDLPIKYKTHFNLREKHNWAEVIEEARIAEMKYKKKADKESPFGRVRGFFRSLQKKSPILDSWLKLLPEESEYASLICGGFKIILRAATRMDEIKDYMIQALGTIPEEVESAQLMIDYNKDLDTSRRLYRRVSSLYYSVFGVLEHIIRWYGQKSVSRHFKAILQQSIYEKELEDKVNGFKEAVKAVKDEANLGGLRRLHDIDQGVLAVQKLLLNLEEALRSNPKLHYRTGQLLQAQITQPPPAPRRKAISRQSLCEGVLRYEPDVPLADLEAIMHRGSELSLKEQDRIVYVIESAVLRNWLLSPRSGTLLVRETTSDPGSSSASAMSFAAAHVVQSTGQARGARLMCLHWFAGQHRNARADADANVHGVVRSLVGQLLHQPGVDFDLYFVKRSTALAIRERSDLRVLCDVLDELLFQLPARTVVFCVIDWIACLEYNYRDDVRYLLDRLRAVARHAGAKGTVFKLLLTHAGGAFRAASAFDGPGEVLDVPEEGDGNRMGFNKLVWDLKVSSKIDHLAARPKR